MTEDELSRLTKHMKQQTSSDDLQFNGAHFHFGGKVWRTKITS